MIEQLTWHRMAVKVKPMRQRTFGLQPMRPAHTPSGETKFSAGTESNNHSELSFLMHLHRLSFPCPFTIRGDSTWATRLGPPTS